LEDRATPAEGAGLSAAIGCRAIEISFLVEDDATGYSLPVASPLEVINRIMNHFFLRPCSWVWQGQDAIIKIANEKRLVGILKHPRSVSDLSSRRRKA
jgi:hypothetical protein